MKLLFSISGISLIVGLIFLAGCGDRYLSFAPEIEQRLPEILDFNYHVKPILSDKCFSCHGPDESKIEAGLRLDLVERATAQLGSGAFAIVPGKIDESELFHRIISQDLEFMMPPPESNLALSEYEKAVLVRWIEQGAEYKQHWAFIPPQKVKLPRVSQRDWVKNRIDQFVLARLEKEGLTPGKEADKKTLIRRVTFDLTGLPPTIEEIDAFMADESADAFEKVVDRLLASSHFGERMAMDWLDVARYADSHGYHADGFRMMWPWRDWVIHAFNKNLAFDDFITWQMAGDLLPEATLEQQLATGFHRNNPVNTESGIVPEEYRLEYVFDRTNTTAKAFLGLTMECARCHDHKYDPISQKEYYQFSAFFNNVDELGMSSVDGNAAPTMLLLDEEVTKIVDFIQNKIAAEELKLEKRAREVMNRKDVKSIQVDPHFSQSGLIGHYPLDKIEKGRTPNLANKQLFASLHGEVETAPGHFGTALRFDSKYEHLSLSGIGDFERTESFSMGAWVYPEKMEHYRVVLGNAGNKNEHWRGYELFLDSLNRASVRLTHRPPDHALQVTTLDSIPLQAWTHLFFTYDGSSKAKGIRLYVNGRPVPLQVQYDRLEKSIRTIDPRLEVRPQPIRVGKSYRIALELGVFEGLIDDIRIYDRRLTDLEVVGLTGNPFWEQVTVEQIEPEDRSLLLRYYLHLQDSAYLTILKELTNLRNQEHTILDSIPEVMVMREMKEARKTYVLDRGVYDAPTEEVQAGTPTRILPFASDRPPNRLGLAHWLTSAENPLTARVIVNRYWHLLFGRGIVHTPGDFGNQGSLPSHPELLDWLALEFMDSGWDLKALFRLVVTSATYRQSSDVNQALLERDPNNELLARGPRHRLLAEMIRDNALMASGLLVDEIGGPSVKTYQPEGLWSNTHFSRLLSKYSPDQGDDLYRRSLYTFIRRTAPPPTMTVLDAPDRSMCTVERQNTSTPLQALLLLNEPQLLEAARLIAERCIKEAGPHVADRLNYAFRLLTSRELLEEERPVMATLYREEYERYRKDEVAARQLLQVGAFPRDTTLELPEVAAMTVAVNVIMNFDETYTKK